MVIANIGIPRVKPNFFKNENWKESLLETFRQHVNMKILSSPNGKWYKI